MCDLALLTIHVATAADAPRDERLRKDLAYAADQITARHPNPFTRITAAEFKARRQALFDEIPTLSDIAAWLQIKALVASVGDAHTSLAIDNRFVYNPAWGEPARPGFPQRGNGKGGYS